MACDINKEARKTYEENYNIEPKGDIAKIDIKTIPDHDVMTAGFPCQPFSICGKKTGF